MLEKRAISKQRLGLSSECLEKKTWKTWTTAQSDFSEMSLGLWPSRDRTTSLEVGYIIARIYCAGKRGLATLNLSTRSVFE